ncbi:MAG: DNA polymerase III subunit beta [Pseudomonadales bacterium]
MKFSVKRDSILKPLQQVGGVVERRQTLPILSNVLLALEGSKLAITGTDLEVEMVANVNVAADLPGTLTVPARKLVDIIRELPEQAEIDFTQKGERLEIRSGRFKSNLSTLPSTDFPAVEADTMSAPISVGAETLKSLLDLTSFAMAQQDVRYFLNGMLLEEVEGQLRSVATDGHRLAMNQITIDSDRGDGLGQVIVPRKGVLEIQRLLSDSPEVVELSVSASHLCLASGPFVLTTKLVDGRFPDYQRVIPKDGDKVILADKLDFKRALNRTAILSNEKFRGVRIQFKSGLLEISTNNPEQEDAEESLPVDYSGPELEIGFNVGYLQDVLNVVRGTQVKLTVNDANSSALIEDPEADQALYVIMPMKL